MIDRALLQRLAADYAVEVDAAAAERLDAYARLLVEWNEKMNLTAITDPVGITVKHFADSLTALPYLPTATGCSLIDVGTGAGFPGIPLAVLRPDLRLTLLDSLNKRLVFLEAVCETLGISATRVHARAEEGGRNAALREQFDVAIARAVAALPVLAEYCLPFVKPGGRFIAMKGPDSDAEYTAADRAIRKLGGGAVRTESLWLPKREEPDLPRQERRLFLIEKAAPTPAAYPRASAKISKAPLG